MPSPFREAAAAHAAAVDAVYGERLRVLPQLSGGRMVAAGADPSRPPADVIGTVTRRAEVIKRHGAGSEGSDNIRLAVGQWLVGFDATQRLDLRAGDHVVRLDEPGEPMLRLSEALPIPGRALFPADPV